jgi:glycosyltransferase involved in cell wall biosynthesis
MASRIIIVGTARDVEDTLVRDILIIKKALKNCSAVAFFIVESDSTDNTVKQLDQLKQQIENFQYVSLGNLETIITKRTERLAHARNVYVEHVKVEANSFDYVIVVDLDGTNSLITEEKIISCFQRNGWGGCTANQLGPYYDVFALRAKDWCDSDCWELARQYRRSGLHPLRAWKNAVRKRQISIPSSREWILVDSAFGGFAIYDRRAFVLGKYATSTLKESNICEHVAFNEQITQEGWKMYINPRLINFDYNKHNDFHRLHRKVKYFVKYAISLVLPNLFEAVFMPELKSESSTLIS